jgi:hypothetical protein
MSAKLWPWSVAVLAVKPIADDWLNSSAISLLVVESGNSAFPVEVSTGGFGADSYV